MSPRVAYWTSSFEPAMEAVASEIAHLRVQFPGSAVWGVSSRDTRFIGFKNGLSFHPRAAVAFRILTALLQWRFDINHLFGSLGDWHHLRSICKRPSLLTICLENPHNSGVTDPIDLFAVEWPAARDSLLAIGIDGKRICTVLPAVDLARFSPSPPPGGPFTVLFASSPDRAEWIESRGVLLLLDAAARCPEMRFHLVWRPWGDSLEAIQREVQARQLNNVDISCTRVVCMERYYHAAHIVVAPFLDMSRCKPMPNSVLEGLACGRPAIVSSQTGIGPLLLESKAGFVCQENAASIVECLLEVQRHWPTLSANARSLAIHAFDLSRFLADYRAIYRGL